MGRNDIPPIREFLACSFTSPQPASFRVKRSLLARTRSQKSLVMMITITSPYSLRCWHRYSKEREYERGICVPEVLESRQAALEGSVGQKINKNDQCLVMRSQLIVVLLLLLFYWCVVFVLAFHRFRVLAEGSMRRYADCSCFETERPRGSQGFPHASVCGLIFREPTTHTLGWTWTRLEAGRHQQHINIRSTFSSSPQPGYASVRAMGGSGKDRSSLNHSS